MIGALSLELEEIGGQEEGPVPKRSMFARLFGVGSSGRSAETTTESGLTESLSALLDLRRPETGRLSDPQTVLHKKK